jgi:erythronate-4-phosphate dehydrogenase
MKIIADKDIYQVKENFSSLGELELIPGREISSNHLKDADALLVRTVTKINRDLIDSSSLRFIGSTSSGYDHVDKELLGEKGIFFCHAPGCNANAVVDYVFAVLAWNARKQNDQWLHKSVGIIGAGNVGSSLAKKLLALGLSISIYDPFLQSSHELAPYFCSLEETLQQDVVTFHTALSASGLYPTYHMVGADLLSTLKMGAILINASRGEVIDNSALEAFLLLRPDVTVALDVWENEPEINLLLLDRVQIATPHIAGYSLNGKLNGTRKIHEEFSRFFSIDDCAEGHYDRKSTLKVDSEIELHDYINETILSAYPITGDCIDFDKANPAQVASNFDSLRNTYEFRKEFNDYQLVRNQSLAQSSEILQTLGFSIL